MKLVISDADEGIKAAVTRVLCATWQRRRVHFMRNVLAHADKARGRAAPSITETENACPRPYRPLRRHDSVISPLPSAHDTANVLEKLQKT